MIYLEIDTVTIPVSLEVIWPVDVEEISQQKLAIYPNPTQDMLYINLEGFEAKSSIEIIDIQGHVIMKQSLDVNQKSTSLNCQNLPQGSYIIRLISGNRIVQGKFVKL